jgi:hypothetical protein
MHEESQTVTPSTTEVTSDAGDKATTTGATPRKLSDTAGGASTSGNVKEVLDIAFHNSADRTRFLAYMYGAASASEAALEDLPEALRTVRSRITSPADSVKCSAATLGNKAWAAVEQTWPSAKHDVYVGTFNVRMLVMV